MTDLIFLDQKVRMLAASLTPFSLPRKSQEEVFGLQSQVVQYSAVPARSCARDAITSSSFACAESLPARQSPGAQTAAGLQAHRSEHLQMRQSSKMAPRLA